MSRERTFRTSLLWHDSRGGEVEAEVNVTYALHPGYAGDRFNPPEGADVEIIKIVTVDGETIVPDHFTESADLIAECFENEADEADAAAEYRAEQARDDRLMDWLA